MPSNMPENGERWKAGEDNDGDEEIVFPLGCSKYDSHGNKTTCAVASVTTKLRMKCYGNPASRGAGSRYSNNPVHMFVYQSG